MPPKKRKPIPVILDQRPNSGKRPPLPVNLPPVINHTNSKRPPLPVTLPTKQPVKTTPSSGQWLRPHSPVYLSLLDTLP